MTRRIWSACCVFLLAWLVVAAVSISTSPCFAEEPEETPGLERVRVQLDEPEVKHPGDDDQPTIVPRRGVELVPSTPTFSDAATQPANDGAATPTAPAALRSWIETLRALVGRIVFVLR